MSWQDELAALWDDASIDEHERVARMHPLAEAAPHQAIGLFELASAHDSAGLETEAAALYEQAAVAGLADVDPDLDAHRQIQHASTLRNVGRNEEAIAMLRAAPDHPQVGAARDAFLALALHDAGRHDEALRVAIEALVPTMPLYRRALTEYAALLTEEPS
ncbi:tetratricopeptide repeat protein [Agrococcus sp. ARC_14]|uniref:tetratricopeptide repeat protein n=1 Tax=Agrococcus sp. ARC_14 TaxID=2919927 RepID=UPI001F066024|nr:tetratricopeptide repeat protein [Agrococcus sp. ARC_14]MCH1883822.1 tetratricopeptide repeat protein [Agrococcus sp. ARC_14]